MHQDRQLAAIMFTDIVGYTSLMETDESEALYILEINRQIIHTALKQFNGHCTKEIGDGTLSTFHSTVMRCHALAKSSNSSKSTPNLI